MKRSLHTWPSRLTGTAAVVTMLLVLVGLWLVACATPAQSTPQHTTSRFVEIYYKEVQFENGHPSGYMTLVRDTATGTCLASYGHGLAVVPSSVCELTESPTR